MESNVSKFESMSLSNENELNPVTKIYITPALAFFSCNVWEL